MAWHMRGSHVPAAECVFNIYSFRELFVEGDKSPQYTILYRNVTLKRDIPPFKAGKKIMAARFDPTTGSFYLMTEESRYFYQVKMQCVPVHSPIFGKTCPACMQFECATYSLLAEAKKAFEEEKEASVPKQTPVITASSTASSTVSSAASSTASSTVSSAASSPSSVSTDSANPSPCTTEPAKASAPDDSVDIVSVESTVAPSDTPFASQQRRTESKNQKGSEFCIFCSFPPIEGMNVQRWIERLRAIYEKEYGPLNKGCNYEKTWHKWD